MGISDDVEQGSGRGVGVVDTRLRSGLVFRDEGVRELSAGDGARMERNGDGAGDGAAGGKLPLQGDHDLVHGALGGPVGVPPESFLSLV
jgi:hypothetical protein